MIASLIFVMMLAIEYLAVQTKGRWQNSLKKSRWLQLSLETEYCKELGDVFFCYAFLCRIDGYEEHGDVFFVVCPFTYLRVQGPENRDELQRELDNTISVRFIPIFGANTKNIEGHTRKKDISLFHAKKTSPCSAESLFYE
jgi:hypothetical protein